ncbi:kunitz trypsin inhibitor 2-like [Raphanus sativus]|uniref:Kunitz trypsin inhibitor 2-like n=1 Tax=Raphanus sativus TaxID=3726 RepID=A0A9W3CFJ9_RAPSA|nr:kunitz trypsin inhibitor 2-like [Raphanus sativus]
MCSTPGLDTSADINIEFRSEIWPACTEFSKLWAVDSSSASKEPAVIVGGELKSPNSAFKIEKAAEAHTYKLTTSYGTVGTTPGPWFGAPKLLVTNDGDKTLFVKFVRLIMMLLLLLLVLRS